MVVALFITGCVFVPYPVIPTVERMEEVRLADDAVVSAGPRRLLERISDRLEKQNEALTVVDPIAFRDAAFPKGGWHIKELLQPGRCQQVAQELGVQFLVLIGGGANRTRDEMGIMMPMMLPAGAMTMGETSVLSAVIIDLTRGETTCRLRSQADGTGAMFAWVLAVAAIAPMTETAAERGLANAILDAITDAGARSSLRVAVLAAEASGDPFVSYKGAPITTGRDAEVGKMVERLANFEDDVVIGTTRREEVQKRLGAPLASHLGLRVDIYRLTALARREVRPFVSMGDADWVAREERSYAGYLLAVYDEAGVIVDIGRTVVAEAVAAPEAREVLESESRSAYDYDFKPSAKVTVSGFQLIVESVGKKRVETLYTEPGKVIVYQNGGWMVPPRH